MKKKLKFSRLTIRNLSTQELVRARGGSNYADGGNGGGGSSDDCAYTGSCQTCPISWGNNTGSCL